MSDRGEKRTMALRGSWLVLAAGVIIAALAGPVRAGDGAPAGRPVVGLISVATAQGYVVELPAGPCPAVGDSAAIVHQGSVTAYAVVIALGGAGPCIVLTQSSFGVTCVPGDAVVFGAARYPTQVQGTGVTASQQIHPAGSPDGRSLVKFPRVVMVGDPTLVQRVNYERRYGWVPIYRPVTTPQGQVVLAQTWIWDWTSVPVTSLEVTLDVENKGSAPAETVDIEASINGQSWAGGTLTGSIVNLGPGEIRRITVTGSTQALLDRLSSSNVSVWLFLRR